MKQLNLLNRKLGNLPEINLQIFIHDCYKGKQDFNNDLTQVTVKVLTIYEMNFKRQQTINWKGYI